MFISFIFIQFYLNSNKIIIKLCSYFIMIQKPVYAIAVFTNDKIKGYVKFTEV